MSISSHNSARSLLAIFGSRLGLDRKSTRLNSSHRTISYAVFCVKKDQLRGDVSADGAQGGVALVVGPDRGEGGAADALDAPDDHARRGARRARIGGEDGGGGTLV